MASINRGDNTGAFGQDFLRIYLNNPNDIYIKKAVFQINDDLEKEYIEPVFPLRVNFTGAETESLHQVNFCKLALWDEAGRRRTADGKFTFFVKENHISAPDEPTYLYDDVVEEENSITFDLEDPEFAAEFVINATPQKMSELQQDIPLMTPNKIIGGRNVTTHVEDDTVIIEATLDTVVSYNSLYDLPRVNGQELKGDITIECEQVQADWTETDPEKKSYILNKPNFSSVAYSGLYSDLIGRPTLPTKLSELENDVNFVNKNTNALTNYYNKEQLDEIIEHGEFIAPITQRIQNLENKEAQDVEELTDLVNEKADKLETETALENKASLDYVNAELNRKVNKENLGKGTLSIMRNGEVLNTFSANEQVNKSVDIIVPIKNSQLENDMNYLTSEDVDVNSFVSKSDYYIDKATFARTNDIGAGTISFKINNETVQTFNANSKLNKEFNIDVPVKLSDLENDVDFLVEDDLSGLNSQITSLQSDFETIPPRITELQGQIDKKVDKELGKTLIDREELTRLSGVHNYNDTEVRALIQQNSTRLDNIDVQFDQKVDKVTGKGLSTNDYTNEDKTRLNNVETLADHTNNKVSSLSNQVGENTTNIADNILNINSIQTTLSSEQQARLEKDNELQEQINALNVKSTVKDTVGTYEDLVNYDTSTLKSGDVICVIKDETKNNVMAYYKWNGTTFLFIGSTAETYTREESDARYITSSRTINGKPLETDILLTYQDVGALPATTEINNNTIMIKKNDVLIDSFTLNQNIDKSINISVPEKTSELNNDADFINSVYMFKYIGNVPEDDNLQDQVDVLRTGVGRNATEIESLRDLITGEIGGLPPVALTGEYSDLKHLPEKLSDIRKNHLIDPAWTGYIDDDFITDLKNKTGYMTEVDIEDHFATHDEIPTKVSQLENDRGYLTNNAVGRGVLTLKINNTEVGTWMANEKDDVTVNIPVDSAMSSTSTLPVQNNVINTALTNVDNSCVHKEGTETIKGNKTFTGVVALGTKATAETKSINDNSTYVATTAYVKNQDYCTNTNAVHKAQNETITGKKTFEGDVTLNKAIGITVDQASNDNNLATTAFVKIQDYSTNSQVVHNTGNETIQGNKTFNDTATFNGIVNLGDDANVVTPDPTDAHFTNKLVVNVEYLNDSIAPVNTRIDNLIQDIADKEVEDVTYTKITTPDTILEADKLYYMTVTQNTSIVTPNITDDYAHKINLQMYVPSTDYTINLGTSITIDEVGMYDITYVWYKPLNRWICSIVKY